MLYYDDIKICLVCSLLQSKVDLVDLVDHILDPICQLLFYQYHYLLLKGIMLNLLVKLLVGSLLDTENCI